MTEAIDKDMEQFNDLAQDRRGHLASCIKNCDNSHKIIAEKIYSATDSHFVYELLQNADDAKAAEISFNIKKDSIDIEHNGNDFTIEDINSITSVGASKKEENEEKSAIGMHGIGFKSVFAITDSPEIHSGKWNFAIKNLIVPEECKARKPQNCQDTLIYIPFKDGITYEGIAEKIKAQLDKHNLLLFLNHLRRITWRFPDSTIEGRTKEICKQSMVNGIDVIDIALKQGQQAENYLLFQKEKTAVAYKQDAQRKSIIALEGSPLFVFLPTELRPKLNFLMQIPYITTANRESANIESSENQNMTKGAATLVADTLPVLRNEGFLTGEFFKDILPLSAPTNEGYESMIYSEIYNHVIEKVKNERLLPATSGKHVTAKEGLMSSQELISLFKDDADFFSSTGSAKWLNAKLNDSQCSDYMSRLGIQRILWANIYDQINPGFLGTKTDEWMKKFYIAIQKGPRSSILPQTIPIIRTSDDEHIPFWGDDEKPQVFLPKDTETRFKTIKKCFAQDDELKDFRKFMGLGGFEISDEIRKLIAPKYENDESISNISGDEHFADVKTVYRAYQNDKNDKTIPGILSDKYFLRGIQNENDVWAYPECYWKTHELSVWWANSKGVVFFDDKHYQQFANQWGQDEYRNFFIALGVKESIRCVDKDRLYERSRGWHYIAVGDFNPKFDVDGLGFALDNINFERSKLIWKMASLDFRGWFFGQTQYSTIESQVNAAKPKDEKSIAGERLLNFDWLYDKNKKPIPRNKHKDLTVGDLHPEYFSSEGPSRQDDELGEHLGLKPRNNLIIEKILEEKGQIAVFEQEWNAARQELDKANRTIERLEEELQKHKQIKEPKEPQQEWEQKCLPKEAQCTITETIKKRPRPQPIPTGGSDTGEQPSEPNNDKNFINQQSIGKWAEEFVLLYLSKNPYCQVSPMNDETNQIGYDIQVKQNGEIIKYVEVKGKVGDRPSYVEISNRQWQMACEHGEKYAIYVVTNVGEINVGLHTIENPKQKFVDGELDAQPIKIKI